MKLIFPILLLCMISVSCKKTSSTSVNEDPPATGMYVSQQFSASQITVTRNITFSTRPNPSMRQYTSDSTKGTDTLSSTLTLRFDVFTPPNATASSRQPLIVYIHGGDFLAGDKEDMDDEAMAYAQLGYVVASVNYRLTPDNESTTLLRIQAIINACEDAENAIRFLKVHTADYFIDSNRIITIGSSAGGGISLINAVEFDNPVLTPSDYTNVSSKVSGAISTGATLIEGGINPNDFLHFNKDDSPILLFHANPEDGNRHTTWTGNVLPTKALIDSSGNTCTVVAQPNLTHTVNLSPVGDYWLSDLKKFIWAKMKLWEK